MLFDLDGKAVLLTSNVRLLGIGVLINLWTVSITLFHDTNHSYIVLCFDQPLSLTNGGIKADPAQTF
jgi:hypothetical protein